ncbi:MAG: OmpA family protein [Opitutaceae bacterium]
MNNFSQKFCLLVASAALLLAGCSKKPARPEPTQTIIGGTPGGGGADSLNPMGLTTGADGLDLSSRNGMNNAEGDRSILKAVYFDFDRFNVKESERPKLQAAKEYLEKNPGYKVVLEGHADWRGTAEYNLSLGDRRANSVLKYLTGIGVGVDKLESNSKGSLESKQNASDADAANDRRVELVVVKVP